MNKEEKIKQILTAGFQQGLFDASIASLGDKSNKLRFNNFAYSIRELSRHFLYSLATEERVVNCSWYVKETEDGKPSRAQRIKYSIQGGLNDEKLRELGFDIENLHGTIKDIKNTIDLLSKFTHINPEVFDLPDEEIDLLSGRVLLTFERFVETIESYRNRLKAFLDSHIEDHIIGSTVSNFFENLETLAPRYCIDFSRILDYHITEINDAFIVVKVSGNIHVTLEYGSRRERAEGDGLDLNECFPFETSIAYEIDFFPTDRFTVEDYDVDTTSWYGDGKESQDFRLL